MTTRLAGRSDADGVIRKFYTASKQEGGPEERTLRVTISTGDEDRDGDVIDPAGWELRNFERNPVVLWAHSHRDPPIGRATEVVVQGKRLRALVEFTPPGMNPLADRVASMYLHRPPYLRGWSVGFNPGEFHQRAGGGLHFTRGHELIEFSAVPLPANPEALNAAGVAGGAVRRWARRVLEEPGEDDGWVARALREARTLDSPLAARRDAADDGWLDEALRPDPLQAALDDLLALPRSAQRRIVSQVLAPTVRRTVDRRLTAVTGRLPD